MRGRLVDSVVILAENGKMYSKFGKDLEKEYDNICLRLHNKDDTIVFNARSGDIQINIRDIHRVEYQKERIN